MRYFLVPWLLLCACGGDDLTTAEMLCETLQECPGAVLLVSGGECAARFEVGQSGSGI